MGSWSLEPKPQGNLKIFSLTLLCSQSTCSYTRCEPDDDDWLWLLTELTELSLQTRNKYENCISLLTSHLQSSLIQLPAGLIQRQSRAESLVSSSNLGGGPDLLSLFLRSYGTVFPPLPGGSLRSHGQGQEIMPFLPSLLWGNSAHW